MNKRHATVIAVLLGLAVLFGTFATLRTTHLGAAGRAAQDAQIAARERQLAAAERSLRHKLAAPADVPAAMHASAPPRTVYVRPAPIVVHLHRHGGEDAGGDREGTTSDD